jgi:hypothetical protein
MADETYQRILPTPPNPVDLPQYQDRPDLAGAAMTPQFPTPNTSAPKFTEPSFGDKANALLHENDFYVLGSLASDYFYPTVKDQTPDPDFHPIEAARGTWAENEVSKLVGLKNRAEFDDFIARGQEHIKNDEILAAGGWGTTALRLANGMVSPAVVMPAFMGPRLLGTAGRLALAGGATAAISEPFYQAEDPTRTMGDAAFSIGAGTIGAVALGKLFRWTPPEEVAKVTQSIKEARGEVAHVERTQGNQTIVSVADDAAAVHLDDNPIGPDAVAVTERLKATDGSEYKIEGDQVTELKGDVSVDPNARITDNAELDTGGVQPGRPIEATGTGGSVGAASADDRSLAPRDVTPTPQLRLVRDKIGNIVDGFVKTRAGGYVADLVTPIGRMMNTIGTSPVGDVLENSMSKSARAAMLNLAETSIRIVDEKLGKVKASGGGAVETYKKIENDALQYNAVRSVELAYAEHAYGSAANEPKARLIGSDYWPGRPQDKMTYEQFNERVFIALNNGDKDLLGQANFGAADAAVEKAAAEVRVHFDKWAERATKAQFEDGTTMLSDAFKAPRGALSYAPHMYDNAKIDGNWPAFVGMWKESLRVDQEAKAAAKERIIDYKDQHEELTNRIAEANKRMAAIDRRIKEIDIRQSERDMVGKAQQSQEEKAIDRVESAKTLAQEVRDDIEFLRSSLDENSAEVKMLERELAQLEKEARPISAKELAQIEKEELERFIVDPEHKKALEIAVGRRKREEPSSILEWIAREGGVSDPGGELMSALGKGAKPIKYYTVIPGEKQIVDGKEVKTKSKRLTHKLIVPLKNELRENNTFNAWAQRFREMAPERFGDEVPDDNEVIDIISEAINGREPDWFRDIQPGAETNRVADAYMQAFENLDVKPKNLKEAMKALSSGVDERVLDRLNESLGAGSKAGRAGEELVDKNAARAEAKRYISKLIQDRRVADARTVGANAASKDIGVLKTENRGRIGQLEDRRANLEEVRMMLETVEKSLQSRNNDVWSKIEKELEGWQGDTTNEFRRALKERADIEQKRVIDEVMGRSEARSGRLRTSDDAARRAIDSIIASHRDLSDTELADKALEIAHNVRGAPAGRLSYDGDAVPHGKSVGMTDNGERGSFKDRTVNIPIEKKMQFLTTDMREVMASYARTAQTDVLLVEKFGSLDFENVFKNVRAEYSREMKSNEARLKRGDISRQTYERQQESIRKQMEKDETNLKGVLERVRGIYGYNPDQLTSGVAAFARDLNNINTLTSLGRAMLNSLNDAGGMAAMRYGVTKVLGQQWMPYINSFMNANPRAFNAEVRRQAREMSIGMETALTLMTHNMDAISNVRVGNRFSKTLAYGASRFQVANGLVLWTDMVKSAAMLPASRNFADAAERFRLGKQTQRDIENMAEANIPDYVAIKIANEWNAHSTEMNGAKFANIDKWNDQEAVKYFKAAMRKEVDTLVITSGVGSSPLWTASTLGRSIGQFKAYMFAAHEKMYLANMQRLDHHVGTGMAFSLGLGAMSYALYQWSKGEEISDNPAQVFKEAFDRGGMAAKYNEVNKILSKATGGNMDIGRAIGATAPLTRRQDNSVLADVFGTGANLIEKGLKVGGHIGAGLAAPKGKTFTDYFTGKDVNDIRTSIGIGQNQFFPGGLLYDGAEVGITHLFGIPRTPKQKEKAKRFDRWMGN